MSKQGTVVEQKQVFLQSRKQLLSRGIAPSERLRTIADDGGIELIVLKGALDKGRYLCLCVIPLFLKLTCEVNRDLKQHSRKVYSRQMIEHVVEQIDQLYWESGAQEVDDASADAAAELMEDNNTLYQSDDLTIDEHIVKLPTVWDTSADFTSSSERNVNQDDYTSAIARLQGLSAQRLILQNKLNTSRTLLSLLEPYRKPKENIQPNLVWKEAPLAPELSKTRTLAIRVAGRVCEKFGDVQVPATAEEQDVDMDGLQDEGKKKLDKILTTW
jgi:hypothetical protein